MPRQRLKIGIVGLNFGRHILAQLQDAPASDFFELAAVCDLDAEKTSQFSEQYSVPGYTDLDQLLDNPDIPVIGLFTGPAGRAGLLRRIIRKGKDVLTCKPFELDAQAARDVLAEARSLGRIIHLNSPAPNPTPFMQKIHEWEKEFNLGQPVYCRGEVTASYREKADGRWLDDPKQCPVAPIFRLGIYLINDLVRLFGAVKSVQVNSTRMFTERPTPDNGELSMVFQNGAIGNIFASFCIKNGQHYGNSLILHYENGSIYRNCDPFEFGKASQSSELRLVAVDDQDRQTIEEWSDPSGSGSYAWGDLHEAVLQRKTDSSPDDLIVHGIQVIQAMTAAEQSGTRETVS